MITGLGTLSQLRALCLPDGFGAADDQFDTVLSNIGRGVAGQFDALCNRGLARAVDTKETFTADREFLSLSRYPVEGVSSLEWQIVTLTGGEPWQAWSGGYARGTNFAAGLIGLGGYGTGWGRFEGDELGYAVRATFTGGYFIPDDPAEDGTPAPVPAGATALPADLGMAWQLQCAHVFEAANYFGTAAIRKPGQFDKMPPLTRVEILPTVRATLDRYVRMVS